MREYMTVKGEEWSKEDVKKYRSDVKRGVMMVPDPDCEDPSLDLALLANMKNIGVDTAGSNSADLRRRRLSEEQSDALERR